MQKLQIKNKEFLIETGLFIHNKFVPSLTGETFSSYNPANMQKICDISKGNKKDLDLAVKSAKNGLKAWQQYSSTEKADTLYRIYERIKKHQNDLAMIEALDHGKSYAVSKKFDVGCLAFSFKESAGWCTKLNSSVLPSNTNELVYSKREPFGITAAINADNYSLIFLGIKLANALACGNVQIVKPAANTSLSTLYFAQIIQDLLPPGALNVVTGSGIGQALCEHGQIRKISFTGSTEVGKKVGVASIQNNLKKIVLNLSGKSVNIIFDDGDIKKAVKSAALGCFANCGQMCIGYSRIYVQEGVYDEFLQQFKEFTKNIEIGDQWYSDSFYVTPTVDRKSYDRVREYIKLGIQEGATLAVGEIPPENPENGYYIKPVIFTDCDNSMRIVREEIFGPVACVMKFKTVEEVIEKSNDSSFGLSSAIFSKDVDKCMYVSDRLQAGMVQVNNLLVDESVFQYPFGGQKESGLGRERGQYGIQEWTEMKTIKLQYNRQYD